MFKDTMKLFRDSLIVSANKLKCPCLFRNSVYMQFNNLEERFQRKFSVLSSTNYSCIWGKWWKMTQIMKWQTSSEEPVLKKQNPFTSLPQLHKLTPCLISDRNESESVNYRLFNGLYCWLTPWQLVSWWNNDRKLTRDDDVIYSRPILQYVAL